MTDVEGKYGPSTALVDHFLARAAVWGPKEWHNVWRTEWTVLRFVSCSPEMLRAEKTLFNTEIANRHAIPGIDSALTRMCSHFQKAMLCDWWSEEEVSLKRALRAIAHHHLLGVTDSWNLSTYDLLLAPVRIVDSTIGVPS